MKYTAYVNSWRPKDQKPPEEMAHGEFNMTTNGYGLSFSAKENVQKFKSADDCNVNIKTY